MEVEGSAGVGVAAQERGASDGTAVEVPPLAAALLLLYCCFTSAYCGFTAAVVQAMEGPLNICRALCFSHSSVYWIAICSVCGLKLLAHDTSNAFCPMPHQRSLVYATKV